MPFDETTITGLKNNTTVELDLFGTNLSEDDAITIATLLEQNTSLKHLCIEYNQLGPKVGFAFAEMLTNNNSLQQLNVSSNFFGDNAVKALINALKLNTSLLVLNVKMNTNPCFNSHYICVEDEANRKLIEPYLDKNKAKRFFENVRQEQVDQQDLLFWQSKVRTGGAGLQGYKVPHTIAELLEAMPLIKKIAQSNADLDHLMKLQLSSPSKSWSSFFYSSKKYRAPILQQLKTGAQKEIDGQEKGSEQQLLRC